MNLEMFINDIESLPPEKQEEVFDFIAFLKTRAKKRKNQAGDSSRPDRLKPDGFFGMWADRESMKDSESWVRQLRVREWER